MSTATEVDHEVIIIGAGVCGIYQAYKFQQLGLSPLVLDSADELGGTWFWNRYPGARFDSESYTYGFSFSQEVLQEWDWKERFSGQPENLKYLQFIADKFDLRQYMRFGVTVQRADFDEDETLWRLSLDDGSELTCRYLCLAVGLLSVPTLPRYDGVEDFGGRSFHTYDYPADVDLRDKRVGVIGTGATAIQLISAIAPEVAALKVFQRRPNWSAPLNNSEISPAEMADIKRRYAEIFELCSRTPGGFVHEPDRRPFYDVPREERVALWERLYQEPGFGIWLANFRDTFMDEEANAELSAWIADRIRERVNDPEVAEKLIPTDHGFGIQRVPMETNYFEVYNRDNVELVSVKDTPIERVTERGIRTTEREYELDVIIYATGFDAITGAYEAIDIHGVGGRTLREAWADGPITSYGLQVPGFPNMIMPNGPQSASATTNFPRGIEIGVDWCTELLTYAWDHGYSRIEATEESAQAWAAEVKRLYQMMLMRKAQGWFTGYNSNIPGHEAGTIRYLIYNGGTPKFRATIAEEAAAGYPGTIFG